MNNSLKDLNEKERKQHAKRVIEALLFSSSDPLSLQKIHEILQDFYPYSEIETKEFINLLKENYTHHQHAFQLDEIAGGYILRTSTAFSPYIEKLRGHKRTEKLSQAGIETIAIIAHKQPIARSAIEAIRGVDSSGILHTLLEKELIEIVGKQEVPGRPSLYGVTKKFLHYFGIKSIQELDSLGKREIAYKS
ncbi:MAG: SMC-Scp complex subunit ScpB [Chlamydiales bacterium]|nr:SMC-Scp complex subunit ScpB [Chlamydiales bacterium]